MLVSVMGQICPEDGADISPAGRDFYENRHVRAP